MQNNIYNLFTKIIMMISLIMIVAGCADYDSPLKTFSSTPVLDKTPPPGPPEYQKAWLDGCELAEKIFLENNAMAGFSRGLGALDPVLTYTYPKHYYQVVTNAYYYCYKFIGTTDRNSGYYGKASWNMNPKYVYGSYVDKLLNSSPKGPPNFKYGWEQGCETGKAATGRMHHKAVYTYQQDHRFINDSSYVKGWTNAFWWCQRFYDVYTSPDRKGIL